MKTCSKCNEIKSFESFNKDKSKKDGYHTVCRICCSIAKKAAYKVKPPTLEPKVSSKFCPTCNNTKTSLEFDNDKRKGDGLAWECKICRAIRYKEQYPQHAEKRKAKSTKYYYENKEKCNKSRMIYQNKREKTDILYRLARRLRNRLYYALKRAHWKKDVPFNEYIGCTQDELKIHLEKQFTEGMSWANWGIGEGKWNIDHVIPLSSAKTEEEITKLCHFSNLKPLWSLDNIKKSNKIGEEK